MSSKKKLDNCIKPSVCASDKVFLIVQKSGDPFITYGTLHSQTDIGEIVVDKEVTKYYSQQTGKEADFLVVFKDWDSPPSWAYYVVIKRNITGIGIDGYYDLSDFYETKGGLKGLIIMPNVMLLGDSSKQFDTELTTATHEIAHHWLMYLENEKLRLGTLHYSDCMYYGNEDYFELEGSSNWQQINKNEFIARDDASYTLEETKFSPLSLYLMGLVPPDFVEPFGIIVPEDGSKNCRNIFDGKYRVKGVKNVITMNDIISIYGPRIPSSSDSPEIFKIQFVLLAHENSSATQSDMDRLDEFITKFEKYFSIATSGKAQIEAVSIN